MARSEPSVADIVRNVLEDVRGAEMALENAVEQDDHPDSWDEAMMAVGRLEDATVALRETIANEYRKRDDA